MKLTRRNFLGLLSAIPFTPLVAKDMADFEFLPPMVERVTRPTMAVTGQIRYNETTQQFEVYTGHHWEVLAGMDQIQES